MINASFIKISMKSNKHLLLAKWIRILYSCILSNIFLYRSCNLKTWSFFFLYKSMKKNISYFIWTYLRLKLNRETITYFGFYAVPFCFCCLFWSWSHSHFVLFTEHRTTYEHIFVKEIRYQLVFYIKGQKHSRLTNKHVCAKPDLVQKYRNIQTQPNFSLRITNFIISWSY